MRRLNPIAQQVDSNGPSAPLMSYAFIAAGATNMVVELVNWCGMTIDVVTVSVTATATSLFDLLETATYDLGRDAAGAIVKPAGDVFYNTSADLDDRGNPVRTGDPLAQTLIKAPTTSSIRKIASGAVAALGRARTS